MGQHWFLARTGRSHSSGGHFATEKHWILPPSLHTQLWHAPTCNKYKQGPKYRFLDNVLYDENNFYDDSPPRNLIHKAVINTRTFDWRKPGIPSTSPRDHSSWESRPRDSWNLARSWSWRYFGGGRRGSIWWEGWWGWVVDTGWEDNQGRRRVLGRGGRCSGGSPDPNSPPPAAPSRPTTDTPRWKSWRGPLARLWGHKIIWIRSPSLKWNTSKTSTEWNIIKFLSFLLGNANK